MRPFAFSRLSYAHLLSRRSLEVELKAIKRGTPHQELNIQKLRNGLFRRILRFHNLQQVFMPNLRHHLSASQLHHLDNPSTTTPESIKLFLPSDLRDNDARVAACVAGVVDAETRLRAAETEDALESLRQGLRARTVTNSFKIRNTTGQVANTRAQGIQRQIDLRVHSNKLRYQYARCALFKLRGPGPWENTLQVLADGDVRGLNERALNAQELSEQNRLMELGLLNALEPGGVAPHGVAVVGDGHTTLSWIWYRAGQTDDDPATMNEGMLNFQYF